MRLITIIVEIIIVLSGPLIIISSFLYLILAEASSKYYMLRRCHSKLWFCIKSLLWWYFLNFLQVILFVDHGCCFFLIIFNNLWFSINRRWLYQLWLTSWWAQRLLCRVCALKWLSRWDPWRKLWLRLWLYLLIIPWWLCLVCIWLNRHLYQCSTWIIWWASSTASVCHDCSVKGDSWCLYCLLNVLYKRDKFWLRWHSSLRVWLIFLKLHNRLVFFLDYLLFHLSELLILCANRIAWAIPVVTIIAKENNFLIFFLLP